MWWTRDKTEEHHSHLKVSRSYFRLMNQLDNRVADAFFVEVRSVESPDHFRKGISSSSEQNHRKNGEDAQRWKHRVLPRLQLILAVENVHRELVQLVDIVSSPRISSYNHWQNCQNDRKRLHSYVWRLSIDREEASSWLKLAQFAHRSLVTLRYVLLFLSDPFSCRACVLIQLHSVVIQKMILFRCKFSSGIGASSRDVFHFVSSAASRWSDGDGTGAYRCRRKFGTLLEFREWIWCDWFISVY